MPDHLRSSRNWTLLVVAITLVACGSSNKGSDGGVVGTDGGSVDAGTADGGSTAACAQIAGTYSFSASSSCSGGYSAPAAACVIQSGCALTVITTGNTMTGTVSGNSVSLSDPALDETCTGTLDSSGTATLSCSAGGGLVTCSLSGKLDTSIVPAGYSSTCCDLSNSTCGSGAQCRPGLVTTPSGSGLLNLCYTATGNVALGQSCMRQTAGIGQDNCAAPLACTLDGVPQGQYQCVPLCQKGSDCPAGDDCSGISQDGQSLGLCMPTCHVFDSPSTCATGMHCTIINLAAESSLNPSPLGEFCEGNGTIAAGQACRFNTDCASGGCHTGASDTMPVCHDFCDATHPCTGGKTCDPISPEPASDTSLGFCD